MRVRAKIMKKTNKAVKLELENGKEFWTPQSLIAKKPQPDFNFKGMQVFIIKDWFLREKLGRLDD